MNDFTKTPLDKNAAAHDFVSSIAMDIVLSVITCGIYNIFVQNRKIKALNYLLKTEKYNFLSWGLLTIVSCYIYHLYHQYRISKDLCELVKPENPDNVEPIISVFFSMLGFSIVADAIQQAKINELFGDKSL